MSMDLWYELFDDGRMIERNHEGGEVFIHTPKGIRGLLEENGLRLTELHGGHDRRPFYDNSEMIVVVAQRA